MDYEQTLKDAQEKLKTLAVQRDAIDREIEALMRIIEGAQIATKDPSYWDPDNPAWVPKKTPDAEPVGVTESMRKVLRRNRTAMLPTEIRDALEAMGIEGSSPKNLLIHVHKTLGRLHGNGEIAQEPREGKMAYRWLTDMERMMRDTTRTFATGIATALGLGEDQDKAGQPSPVIAEHDKQKMYKKNRQLLRELSKIEKK
ncbi:MAG TPA: hypothetical protein VF860_04630 [Candidatus Acidoferrales bacterium]